MIDCHVHLWDPARGFPWIKPGGEHHQVYGEDELERSGAGLGLTGAVLVEASRGDAGRRTPCVNCACAARIWSPDTSPTCTSTARTARTPSVPSCTGWAAPARPACGSAAPHGTTPPNRPGRSFPYWPKQAWPWSSTCTGTPCRRGRHRRAAPRADRRRRPPGQPAGPAHSRGGEWYRDIEHAAASPDVVVKISGLLTQQHGVPPQQVAHMVRHVVDTLGPGRCLIGSDWPICLPAARGRTPSRRPASDWHI